MRAIVVLGLRWRMEGLRRREKKIKMHRGEFLSRLGPCLARVAPRMQVQELSGPLANRAMCRLLKRLAARVCSWSQSCLCLCNPQRSGHCEGGDHRLWAHAGGKTGRFLCFHLWKMRDHLVQRLYIKWTASQLVCKLIGHIIYMTSQFNFIYLVSGLLFRQNV